MSKEQSNSASKSKWPQYYKEMLVMGAPDSNVGIVTLWTPAQNIVGKMDKKHFNVAGQLYSHRGVNFIVRNILAYPQITKLVVCGLDRSGSFATLQAFIDNGVDKNHEIIGTGVSIDNTIDLKAVEILRKNVEIIDLVDEFDPQKIEEAVKKVAKNERLLWAKPQTFPDPEPLTVDRFPSERTTYQMRANLVWEGWVQALRHINKFGSRSGMIKVGELKELVNLVITIDGEKATKPEIIDEFPFDKKDLLKYIQGFFSITAEKGSYNYGERILAYPFFKPDGSRNTKHKLNQIQLVIDKLKRDTRDRGSIACLWNPWGDNHTDGWMSDQNSEEAGNTPCLTWLQFTHRSKRLHLTAYFRSNDIFSAWPLNAFALLQLQAKVAQAIGRNVGNLVTVSNCAHVYERDYQAMEKVLEKFAQHSFCQPEPRGNCYITTKGKDITIKHLSPNGNETMEEYTFDGSKQKSADFILTELHKKLFFSRIDHAYDVAIQIAKAEYCVKKGIPFIQDRDWSELLAEES